MVRLTLIANELAIVAIGLHCISADSHYLQIKIRSDWQSGPQHFLPQLGRPRWLQGVVEHGLDLRRLGIEQFDQILGAVAVACQRWLQVVNMA